MGTHGSSNQRCSPVYVRSMISHGSHLDAYIYIYTCNVCTERKEEPYMYVCIYIYITYVFWIYLLFFNHVVPFNATRNQRWTCTGRMVAHCLNYLLGGPLVTININYITWEPQHKKQTKDEGLRHWVWHDGQFFLAMSSFLSFSASFVRMMESDMKSSLLLRDIPFKEKGGSCEQKLNTGGSWSSLG